MYCSHTTWAHPHKECRYRPRDQTLLLLMYRHVIRVEAVALRSHAFDLKQGLLHAARLKNGMVSTHPLRGSELRALRRLKRECPAEFLSVRHPAQRAAHHINSAQSTVRKLIARVGQRAGLEFPVHPHMLRHSIGYKLANKHQDTWAM